MINAASTPLRCGIVLAGGEGERLRSFIRQSRGSELPKQYVNFIGKRSMLEHTLSRAEKLIPPERLFTIVNKGHLAYPEVSKQLVHRTAGTVVIQPVNRETGPGVLLPLTYLAKRYPDASIAVFPSDHFILEEDLFMAYIDMALRVVERYLSSIVLIGVKPTSVEREYGYILPCSDADRPWGLRRVLRFVEKPDPVTAQSLIHQGGLWNTLVIAFKARTLLDRLRRAWPRIYAAFQRIGDAIGTSRETDTVERIYQNMEPMNLSKGLLETLPQVDDSSLWVLPVPNVHWSDWGSAERILHYLKRDGRRSQIPGAQETFSSRG